jgi:hypothetical protein
MITVTTEEDVRQLELLMTGCGEVDSGRARYAAAMYFYWRGMIGDETLEVYRVCSRLDHEDPVWSLRRLGLVEEIGHRRTGWADQWACRRSSGSMPDDPCAPTR